MQFITVYAKYRDKDSTIYGIPVLINSERNGRTGCCIKLPNAGIYDVSVDFYGADTISVAIESTEQDKPKEIVVLVGMPEIKPIEPFPDNTLQMPGV